MEKRGVSIFVFTIMFTLIAGAIILVFFFSFGKNLFSFSSELTKTENLLVLEKNLASFALSSNSEKTITFSEDSYIDINCVSGKFELQAEKTVPGERGRTIPTEKLIFSPFPIKSSSVQAWTLAWNYPFKIDNLYFVADDKTTFYFPDYSSLATSSPAKYFVDKFDQTKFNVVKGTPPNALQQAVIVYFVNAPPTPTTNQKVVQLIDLGGSNPQVKLWKDSSSMQIPIWGDAMVYAAIFSADYDKFNNCVINGLGNDRIKNMVEIYKDTVPKLGKANNGACAGIDEYRALSGDSGWLDKLANNNPNNKQDAAKQIKELNDDLKSTECPVLFKGVETLRLI